MSDDLTQKLLGGIEPIGPHDGDKISVLISAVQLLSANFQSLSTGFREVEVRLAALEKTVTERSLETKPIWERALSEIAETRAELAETRAELAETRAELKAEMMDGFRKIALKIELLNEDSLTRRADQRQLERRVENLEPKNP
jgi:septal ring factor EnvC (AmiA/AmiB activator)